jgi:hypothetical protein
MRKYCACDRLALAAPRGYFFISISKSLECKRRVARDCVARIHQHGRLGEMLRFFFVRAYADLGWKSPLDDASVPSQGPNQAAKPEV